MPRCRAAAAALLAIAALLQCVAGGDSYACVPASHGTWTEGGQDPKIPYVWADDGCVRPYESVHDFVSLFSGMKITVIGDSLSREMTADTMMAAADCANPAANHVVRDGEGSSAGWWTRGGHPWADIRDFCNKYHERLSWHEDLYFEVPGGAGHKPVSLQFRWNGFTDQYASVPWFEPLFEEGPPPSAPIIMSLGTWDLENRDMPLELRENRYLTDLGSLIARLGRSKHVDAIKRWLYWWQPYPPESAAQWRLKRSEVIAIGSKACDMWEAAGFKTLRGTPKYSVYKDSTADSQEPREMSRDGSHFRTYYHNLALSREVYGSIYMDTCIPSYKLKASVDEAKNAAGDVLKDLWKLWTAGSVAADKGGAPDAAEPADAATALAALASTDLAPVPLARCADAWEAIHNPPGAPPLPSPTPSPSVSPSPSVTPTATASATPSVTPTPSATPSGWLWALRGGAVAERAVPAGGAVWDPQALLASENIAAGPRALVALLAGLGALQVMAGIVALCRRPATN